MLHLACKTFVNGYLQHNIGGESGSLSARFTEPQMYRGIFGTTRTTPAILRLRTPSSAFVRSHPFACLAGAMTLDAKAFRSLHVREFRSARSKITDTGSTEADLPNRGEMTMTT